MEDEKCLDLSNATIEDETIILQKGASYDSENECINIEKTKDKEKKNDKN